jgi:hypothetical protein
MAFIFEVDKNGHARPKIRCDACGGIIENHAHGVVTLDDPNAAPGTVVEPIFRCIGCEEEAEKSNPPRRTMSIDHFMLYVMNNIQLTPNSLEQAGRNLKDATIL